MQPGRIICLILVLAILSACSGSDGNGVGALGTAMSFLEPAPATETETETETESEPQTDDGAQVASGKPDVIFIVVDTLRQDRVSLFGYPRNTTPNINAFADGAYTFTNAIAPASWTLPAFASIMTGMNAFNHNKNTNDYQSLIEPVNRPLINGFMESAGYSSVSVQTNALIKYLDYGFQKKYNFSDGALLLDEPAAQKAIAIIDSMTGAGQPPLFLFIGLVSPHWPYRADTGYFEEFVLDSTYNSQPFKQIPFYDGVHTYDTIPESVRERLGPPTTGDDYYSDSRLYVAAYDGEVKYSDSRIGLILDDLRARGLYDSSMIIITSDHGENMIEHTPNFEHGDALYNSQIHVPLFIKMPNQTEGGVVTDYVRTIDILPTILEAIGSSTGWLDGKSLIPLMNGESMAQPYSIVSYLDDDVELPGIKTKKALIEGDYKFVSTSEEGVVTSELYNITVDNDEQYDLEPFPTYSDIISSMIATLERILQSSL